jgi:hypothetical protein
MPRSRPELIEEPPLDCANFAAAAELGDRSHAPADML